VTEERGASASMMHI